MSDQTLPDFLFSVITEQRKSVSSLVDALNEAKNGINQLSVSAERSEESRRQVEVLLERQSVVESDLKFDLMQCRQHNEVLQGQVKTLEENLERTEKLLFVVTEDRDAMQDACGHHTATIHAQTREIAMRLEDVSALKIQVASMQEMLEQSGTVVTTQHREILKYQDEIATLKLRLAAGTLDCAVPTAETPAVDTEAAECFDETKHRTPPPTVPPVADADLPDLS